MPTYVYETIPQTDGQESKQFEIEQRMSDPALTKHPETGEPVQRVISGGISLPIASGGDDCCGSTCGCG
ncbi:MAG TPA: hypothetical protein DCG12_15310 [Planctomycetaceae bacterium]|nr:hypothetical protein [Planctomycetaceae bacterium]